MVASLQEIDLSIRKEKLIVNVCSFLGRKNPYPGLSQWKLLATPLLIPPWLYLLFDVSHLSISQL